MATTRRFQWDPKDVEWSKDNRTSAQKLAARISRLPVKRRSTQR